MIGPDPDIEAIQGIIQETDIIETQSKSRDKGQRSRTVSRDKENRSRSSSCVSTNRDRLRCYRCNEYDHFARECPNMMSDEGSDQDNDLGSATWQLLTQEETAAINYSEIDDLNM